MVLDSGTLWVSVSKPPSVTTHPNRPRMSIRNGIVKAKVFGTILITINSKFEVKGGYSWDLKYQISRGTALQFHSNHILLYILHILLPFIFAKKKYLLDDIYLRRDQTIGEKFSLTDCTCCYWQGFSKHYSHTEILAGQRRRASLVRNLRTARTRKLSTPGQTRINLGIEYYWQSIITT